MAGINPATAFNNYFGAHGAAPTHAFHNTAAATGPGPEAAQRDVTTNVPPHVGHNIPAKSIHGTAVAGSTNMDARLTWLHHRTEQQQFELDVAMWYGLMQSLAANRNKLRMVRRIFTLLHWGGLFYKREGQWRPWYGSGMPLAAALSHGGRVIVELPPGDQAYRFWRWLWRGTLGGGIDPEANHRSAATHGASYNDMPELVWNKSKFYTEDKLSPVSPRSQNFVTSYHYGLNIGVGGDGNVNPFSGMTIDDSGAHGHLYIYYRQEAEKNSLCMISCEDSAPMDRYQGTWQGIWHGNYAVGQTGHAHKFGGAGAFTATGGKTWDQQGWTATGPDSKYNCLYINLASPILITAVMASPYSDAYISSEGDGQSFRTAVAPSQNQWMAMTNVTMLLRDSDLKRIDALLMAYRNAQTIQNYNNLAKACGTYRSVSSTRMAAVRFLTLMLARF